MTLLHSLDIDVSPAGTAINGSAVAGTNETQINGAQSGTRPVSSATIPPNYTDASFSAQVDLASGTSFNNITFAQQSGVWVEFYFQIMATTAAHAFIINWYSAAGTKIGDAYQVAGSASLGLRDNNGSVGESSSIGTSWVRARIKAFPGSSTGHRLKLYTGTGIHDTTPTYDTGDQAATASGQTNVAGWRFGLLSGAEAHYRIARVRIGTTEGDMVPIYVPPANNEFWLDSDGLYKPCVIKNLSGGVWV